MSEKSLVATEIRGTQSKEDAFLLEEIRRYWNEHIHDLEIAKYPVGTKGFFDDLDEYRFDKLRYLPEVVDFTAYKDKLLLEVGCGVGIDLVRFAKGGAIVTGIDLSETAISLAKKNFELNGLKGDLIVMNGEDLKFDDESFELIYAHGVLQYTARAERMVDEIYRVLRPGGEAIMMVYNKYSWLNFLSKLMKVDLEHEDAPVLRKYSIREFKRMLGRFSKVDIIPERFPVKTRLHHGMKAMLYNSIFVRLFNAFPRPLVRPLGWHIMAKAIK
ncbi:MAG: class I SAM-dependent methyltransferase [Ignavibacteriales bacterium]